MPTTINSNPLGPSGLFCVNYHVIYQLLFFHFRTKMEGKAQQYSSLLLKILQEYQSLSENVSLNGSDLTISQLYHMRSESHPLFSIDKAATSIMTDNSLYLENKVKQGTVIYGVNTGYGGSADVRSEDIAEVQRSLIRHLNAGFGDTLPCSLVKGVMVVRSNSLCLGYSGVRPCIPKLLCDMVNKDIIPLVPKRGSVSASGDLMPTSYIAACMIGREDAKVQYQGQITTAVEAFKDAGLEHVTFQAKEALAVINSASFASSLASYVLFDATVAIFLTQVATALSVEALQGRVESFHPTIHRCLPHSGQQEVASTIKSMLKNSKFAIQELEINRKDKAGTLKQDRYALRSSPQWLAPVVETLQESIRRVTIELNSANDNPIIDHRKDEILHGANFQGTSITVAMDQARQSIQLCGKLLLGQMQEIVNYTMNNGLPPNLNGSDVNTDFGFKGTDTAMASYMSELDFLTNNMSNHVLSTEMHNQAVNSMALVSARFTEQALEILQMMLCNIMCAQVQAIDLRWLKSEVSYFVTCVFWSPKSEEVSFGSYFHHTAIIKCQNLYNLYIKIVAINSAWRNELVYSLPLK